MTNFEPTALERISAPALSVIVVNHNAGPLLVDCIGAVLASGIGVEVHVSDNESTDDSLAEVRRCFGSDSRVSLLENGSNLGFAGGSNLALRHARAPYLLFLNPDCIVGRDTLARMLAFMEATPGAGLAGCTIRNPDGSEQVASRRVIPNPWVGLRRLLCLEGLWPNLDKAKRLNQTDKPLPEAPLVVDAVSGAFILVRRTALEEVGPLDEGYFLHCEDLDWFVRFAQVGWKIYLVPDVEVVHHKGVCSTSRPLWVEWHKHRGMVRFFRKFQFASYPLPFSLLVILGIWFRFGLVVLGAGLRRILAALSGSVWR